MNASVTTGEADDTPSFRGALPPLAFLASLFFLNFTSRVVLSPLMPTVSDELGLSHGDAGSLFLFMSCGYFVSIILSGHVAGRINHKRTIVLSSVASGIMLLLISGCTGLLSLRLGLMSLGFAAGLYLPSAIATITRLVPLGYMARGMSVHELAPNLSFVVTPLACSAGLLLMDWRTELRLLGLLLVTMGVIYGFRGRSAGIGVLPRAHVMLEVMRRPRFWLITVMFSMAICSTLGVYAMLPLFLVSELEMELDAANSLVAFSRIGSVCMPLLAGWLGDRFGNQRVMGGVLFVAGVLTVPMGYSDGWMLVALVVVQPMVAVCFFPSAFAVVAAVGPRDAGNVAISLCIPLAFLGGGGMLPTVIGIIGDHLRLGVGISAAGCLVVLASLLAIRLRRMPA